MVVIYSRTEFMDVKNNMTSLELDSNVLNIISLLVIKPCFLDKSKFRSKIKYQPKKTWRINRPVIGNPANTVLEKKQRAINSLLNKISKDNYSVILNKILEEMGSIDEQIVSSTIDNIFQKSIIQPNYCPYYVQLCLDLIDNYKDCKILIKNKCDNYFEMIKYNKIDIVSDNTENINDKQKEYDNFCKLIKAKTKKKGFSQFVGELYLKKIIQFSDIDKITNILINNIKDILAGDSLEQLESNIICLTKLLNTVSNNIKKNSINLYVIEIKSFYKHSKIIKRLQFSLMDICDNLV